MNYRKLYELAFGPQPGKEIHHIIPKHQGGLDVLDNLVALTKEEHQQAHLDLYNKYGDFRDLCAYHMIVYNFTEAHRISSSFGGTKGGNIMKILEIGVCTKDKELRNEWIKENRPHYVKNGIKQRDTKNGIHGLSKEENKRNASKGGKKGGFTNSEIQRKNGRKGGAKNKGFAWVTNEIINIKYSVKMLKEKSVEDFLKENPEFRSGKKYESRRTYTWVTDDILSSRIFGDVSEFLKENPLWKLGQAKQKNPLIGWYTDGIKSYRYTTKENSILSFEDFLKQNPQFKKGRYKNKKARRYVRMNDGQINTVFYLDSDMTFDEYLLQNPQFKKGKLKRLTE